MTKEVLNELRRELMKPDVAFRQTELYKLLKVELSVKGYSKNKPRGNPKKGFRQSPAAQQTAEIRKQTKKEVIISYEPLDD